MDKFLRKKLIAVLVSLGLIFSALALTPVERDVLEQAQGALRQGMAQHAEALKHIDEAEKRAATSDEKAAAAGKHAKETEDKFAGLQKQIDDSHRNEQRLADRNAILEPVYEQVHKWFGVGAIVLGVTILIKHLLWFSLFAGLTVGALYIASFFFPVIGVGLKLAGGFLSKGGPIIKTVLGALRKPLKRLHDAIEGLTVRLKKKPTPQD